MIGCGAIDAAARVHGLELSAGCFRMEHLADVGTVLGEPSRAAAMLETIR